MESFRLILAAPFRHAWLLAAALFLGCSSKQERGGIDHAAMYAASHSDEGSRLRCNFFSDNSFQGAAAAETESDDGKVCSRVNIINAPSNLFESKRLFLQAYPFAVKREKLSYGPSLEIETYSKKDGSLLISSKIIDSFLADNHLGAGKKSFFADHWFRFCGVTSEWDGIQLVIYLRRGGGAKAAPLAATKFLLPPFLSDPARFQEEKGLVLAALHPFLGLIGGEGESEEGFSGAAMDLCKGDLMKL